MNYKPNAEKVAKVLWENLTIRSIVFSGCPSDEFTSEARDICEHIGDWNGYSNNRISLNVVAEICYIVFRQYFIGGPKIPLESNPCWLSVAEKIVPWDHLTND